jgi:hypothetical protein
MSKKPPDKQSSKRNRKQGQGVPDNSQTLGFLQNNPLGEDSSSKVTNKIKLSGISIENIAVKKIDEYLDEKLFIHRWGTFAGRIGSDKATYWREQHIPR